MEHLKLQKFKECCSYCFKDTSDGINVCDCYLSFCDDHILLHRNKNNCLSLYRVENSGKLRITGNLTEDEKIEALKRLDLVLKCADQNDKIIFKKEELECPDIKTIDLTEKIKIGKIKDLKCKDCEIKTHLYICFTCGLIGCGRIQYGIEGNGHAIHHYNVSGHPIFVLISSITPEYDCDTFCYKCEDFVVNPNCQLKIQCQEFPPVTENKITNDIPDNTETVNECEKIDGDTNGDRNSMSIMDKDNDCQKTINKCDKHTPTNNNNIIPTSTSILTTSTIPTSTFTINTITNASPFVGIQNAGNTCFISSVLQLIGSIIKKEDVDLDLHFKVCDEKSPLDCIFCQSCKIFNEMKKKEKSTIKIKDFIRLVWIKFPIFEKNCQQDANEFLISFLDFIKEAEFLEVFPSINRFFQFKIENCVYCDSCKEKKIFIMDQSIIYVPFNFTLQDSIDEYFKDQLTTCSCGKEKRITNKIISLPKYLIITVQRCDYKNNSFSKITNCLRVDPINLSKHIKQPTLSNYFIQQLISKGFTEDEVKLGLLSTDKVQDTETVISEYKNKNRTDSCYSINGAIIHTGLNMNAGHYMYFVNDKDKFYLINDMIVKEEGVEYFEQSYITCLQ